MLYRLWCRSVAHIMVSTYTHQWDGGLEISEWGFEGFLLWWLIAVSCANRRSEKCCQWRFQPAGTSFPISLSTAWCIFEFMVGKGLRFQRIIDCGPYILYKLSSTRIEDHRPKAWRYMYCCKYCYLCTVLKQSYLMIRKGKIFLLYRSKDFLLSQCIPI